MSCRAMVPNPEVVPYLIQNAVLPSPAQSGLYSLSDVIFITLPCAHVSLITSVFLSYLKYIRPATPAGLCICSSVCLESALPGYLQDWVLKFIQVFFQMVQK